MGKVCRVGAPHAALICLALATPLGSGPAAASDIGVSVQGAFGYYGGDTAGYDLNTMNRGDNPFAALHFLLLSQARIDDRTSLFLEVPVNMSATSSTFLTYFRPFLRVGSVAGVDGLNLQAGKLPTLFGTYGERATSTERGIIGTPLLFYYHTAVRSDLVPDGNDYFFGPGVRGHGNDPVLGGARPSYVGLPLIYDACWDTGVELYGDANGIEASGAVTLGTVSHPMTSGEDDNRGYQVIGRLGYRVTAGPLFGLRAGVSGAAGPYLNADVVRDSGFPAGRDAESYTNTALGVDLAYARGAWQFFAEAGRLGYEVPNVSSTLHAAAYYVEAERSFGPIWSVAARQEGVYFNRIRSSDGRMEGWDYDLRRWEAALNCRFRPGVRLRVGYQIARSPDTDDLDAQLVAVQLQAWSR